MNTKSLFTKAVLTAGAIGVLAGAGATAASAATTPAHQGRPVTAVTQIIQRYDGGGKGNWAYDGTKASPMVRTLTLNYLGKSTDPAMAATPYMYNALITDKGTFKDIPGAFTPNQGGRYLNDVLRPNQVSGPVSGYGQFGVFYASQKAHNGLVPTVLRGTLVNSMYPSSTWPELAFPQGTTFSGVSESVYDYNYSAVPFTHYVVKTVHGKHVIVKVTGFKQHWEDSSFNNDGQLVRDGNILGR
jgi:hypothetical protein